MIFFFIDISFTENSSLQHVGPMWSAVLMLMHGVIDNNHQWSPMSLASPTLVHLPLCMLEKIVWSAVSLTPPTSGQRYIVTSNRNIRIRTFWKVGSGQKSYKTATLIVRPKSPLTLPYASFLTKKCSSTLYFCN
jgi:hypothetical protein